MKFLIFNRSLLLLFLSLSLIGFFLLSPVKIVHSQSPNIKPNIKPDKTPDSAQDKTQAQIKKAPLHIISDKMIAQREIFMVEFIGNVKATQTDSVILADSIKIFFSDKTKKKDASKDVSQNNVKKIISSGNVKYTAGDRKAFADKAVYTTIDGTLILTGESPKLVTGSSFVTGKKITLFRNQDKVLVESDGNKRVEALFNPEDNPNKKP